MPYCTVRLSRATHALLHCQALPHPKHSCATQHEQSCAPPCSAITKSLTCQMCLHQDRLCASQCMPSCATQLCQTRATDLAHVSLRKRYEPIKKLKGTVGQAALSQLLHEGSQPSAVKLGHAFCRNLHSKLLEFLGWGVEKAALSVGMRVCRAAVLPNIAHMQARRHAVSNGML